MFRCVRKPWRTGDALHVAAAKAYAGAGAALTSIEAGRVLEIEKPSGCFGRMN